VKSVIVTGAAGGIGKSICDVFHRNGYKVIGVDCRESAELPCELLRFDISSLGKADPSCKEFAQKVETLAGGRLDALVNNAAVQRIKPVNDITREDWETTLNTNLLAPFWLTQRFLPLLKAAKGSVVNIASIHALLTKEEFTLYSTSKGALVSLTRALALDLAPDVRVNAVLPAATDTLMLRDGFKDNMEGLQSLASYHPLGRIAQTEEVAQAALFLASSQSSFMTGAAISVDGGIGACLHDPFVTR
jgi:NAD(P)-dependent dehydrogenase (short-subunit alcohol dehydrogenase family)